MVFEINAEDIRYEDDHLEHVGVIEKSGRYPWGSGEDPYQRLKDFGDRIKKMKLDGVSETDIARAYGMTTKELRDYIGIADAKRTSMEISQVKSYRDRGWSYQAIADKTGLAEATVRNRLKPEADKKFKEHNDTVATLKAQADSNLYLDVSAGTEAAMGVSKGVKDKAIRDLQGEGYEVHMYKQAQLGTGEKTNINVLVPPGVTWQDVHANAGKIAPFAGSVEDNIVTPNGWVPPKALSPDRVKVNFGEDGGGEADGVMYLRRGVDDISMGANQYAQVRIQVGNKHYLKGMAVYADDDEFPKGVDVIFNTPKSKSNGKLGVLKELETLPDGSVDPDNPFGSTIRKQIKDASGTKAKSVVNIVNVDSDDEITGWDNWSKNLASQFLSKQSLPLAQTQLELTRAQKQADFDEIKNLTNPTVKKKLLADFADSADSSAEHLKTAALPGQKTHVILPVKSLKDNEVYAPNYKNGERLVLVRYPHAGTFEIPELIVNNRNPEGEKRIGKDSKSALGINARVAEKLSGADFDGDTVVAIPNNSGRIRSGKSLSKMEGFDAKAVYGPPADFDAKAVKAGTQKPPYKLMSKSLTQTEMGKVSNLITDMTILGASDDEMARAVKHSQVVIDANKHNLDYSRSYADNDISGLKKKYQAKPDGTAGGASTLISRASSQQHVAERKLRSAKNGGPINTKTGEIEYEYTGTKKRKLNKTTGEWEDTPTLKTTQSTKMRETKDAHSLSSGSAMESLYADHANEMKSLANQARLEYTRTPKLVYNKEANAKYKKEVDSLDAQLRAAEANAPRERQAQRVAKSIVDQKTTDNPSLLARENKDSLSKIEGRALTTARERVGAKKKPIVPTEREWEAIQAGAVSDYKLQQILRNSDSDRIRQMATPRHANELSTSQQSLIRALRASGHTTGEVAERLGVSAASVSKYE